MSENTAAQPDLRALLDDGLALFATQVRAIGADDWARPTPCDGWTVRDLVGHVLTTMTAGARVLRGEPVPAATTTTTATTAADGQDGQDGDAERVEELARGFRTALAGADLSQTRDTPTGPRTLADGLAFPIVDLAVHSWDLGTALGRPVALPAPLLAYADAFSRSVPASVTRRPGVFGPEQPAPDGASPTETLMAFLGRPVRVPTVDAPETTVPDVWTRLTGPASDGASAWVVEQLRQVDSAGTTDAVDIQGLPVVVLTMLGRRSGTPRRVPLMRVEHDGVYAAVASKGGAPDHPAWHHNLVAHPELLLQDGATTTRRVARLATDAERSTWWPRCVEAFPPYAEYVQQAGERVIPVFLLEAVAD